MRISDLTRSQNLFAYTVLVVTMLLLPLNGLYAHDTGAQSGLLVYSGIVVNAPVHQYLTREALSAWVDAPVDARIEMNEHASSNIYSELDTLCKARYDPDKGDDLIIGSGEEDQAWNPLFCPTPRPTWLVWKDSEENGYFEHFWNPDEPNAGGDGRYNKGLDFIGIQFDSSYVKAARLWDRILRLYNKGAKHDISEAYYWLGRLAHLVEDLAVPAHVHGLPHDPYVGSQTPGGCLLSNFFDSYFACRKDKFEDYIGRDMRKLEKYRGSDPKIKNVIYKYEDLPGISVQKRFQWKEVDPWMNQKPSSSRLFRLLWYTAQKTQYFASAGGQVEASGDGGTYDRLRPPTGHKFDPDNFDPPLWVGDNVTIVEKITEVEKNLDKIVDALIPHAVRAVASLYRLFWDETHPTARPLITASLKILEVPPYRVGQTLTAQFTVESRGTADIALDGLLVRGRLNNTCPDNACPDFEETRGLPLPVGHSQTYTGKFVPHVPGKYHFFTAYRTRDGQWNTAIPTVEGVTNTLDITVEPVPRRRGCAGATHPITNNVVKRIGIEWRFSGPIAITPDCSTAYVGMKIGPKHGIILIDTNANHAVGAITLKNPSDHILRMAGTDLEVDSLAIVPDGRRVYALAGAGHITPQKDIVVIDSQTNRVVDRMRVSGGRAMALTPDGLRALVVGAGPQTPGSGAEVVGVFDLGTKRQIATIPVGRAASAIAVRPDGRRAYVINENDGSISVIDLTSNQVSATISLMLRHRSQIAISPDGSRAYVAAQRMLEYDRQRVNLERLKAGETVYETVKAQELVRAVTVIDLQTNQEVGLIRLPQSPHSPYSMAISPDGMRVFVGQPGSINVVDATTGKVIVSLTGAGGLGMAVTPDGSRVYATTHQDEIVLIE